MELTNTLTRKKEKFKPLKEEKVKVYYCGPTPYNYSHIGNLRAYLFSDMVVRTLRYLGYKVETTMNITDIDDKTIKNSIATWVSLKDLTEKYSNIFFDDLTKLWIRHADNISPISNLIPEMIEIINWLFAKWYAYLAEDGSIYFSISKFKNYWELAHLDVKWMKSSVRINNDEYEKEEVADFALWKAYDETKDWPNKWEWKFIIDWEEKIIWWRPGWHIECSACNMKYFWPQIDLHMWWIDNIFPHHQNEIAQTESYTGKTFSKYWAHNWHVLVDNRKMAKRDWTFLVLSDIVEKMKEETSENIVYRWYRFLSYLSKYSDSFNFTFDRLRQSISNIKWFDETFRRMRNYNAKSWKVSREVSDNIQYFIQNYISCMENDFDTVNASSVIFELFKYINSWIDNENFTLEEISAIKDLLKSINEIFNVFDFEIFESNDEIPEEIKKLLELRNEAKALKDYSSADKYRLEIENKWYIVKDSKSWSMIEKIR